MTTLDRAREMIDSYEDATSEAPGRLVVAPDVWKALHAEVSVGATHGYTGYVTMNLWGVEVERDYNAPPGYLFAMPRAD